MGVRSLFQEIFFIIGFSTRRADLVELDPASLEDARVAACENVVHDLPPIRSRKEQNKRPRETAKMRLSPVQDRGQELHRTIIHLSSKNASAMLIA